LKKPFVPRLLPLLLALTLLLSGLVPVRAAASYPDLDGHWSGDAMLRAIDDGLLRGFEDGSVRPDAPITAAQMFTILCRVLNAQDTAALPAAISADAWYADAAAKALALHLITPDVQPDAPMTRLEAMRMIAEAFQLTRAEPDESVLDGYRDTVGLSAADRRMTASLVSDGYILGYDGLLDLRSDISRAQFIVILYRIVSSFIDAARPTVSDGRYVISGGTLTARSFRNGWLDCSVGDVVLSTVRADAVVIRGQALKTVALRSQTVIDRLILAGNGSIAYAPGSTNRVNTLAIGSGSGEIAVEAAVPNIEINGSGRRICLNAETETLLIPGNDNTVLLGAGCSPVQLRIAGTGNTVILGAGAETVQISGGRNTVRLEPDCTLQTLTVSGNGNVAVIEGDAVQILVPGGWNTVKTSSGSVGRLDVSGGDNAVLLDGTAAELYLNASGIRVTGSGSAAYAEINEAGCTMEAACTELVDQSDHGLRDVTITLHAPETLPAGEPLRVRAEISGAQEGRTFAGTWYLDGAAVLSTVAGNGSVSLEHLFSYTRDLPAGTEVSFVLTYTGADGRAQSVSASAAVSLENYPVSIYDEWDAALEQVTCDYLGNYTLAWAEANDYTPQMKTAWINAKGYSSDTQYLLWVNRAYQRVNVFVGSAGRWTLDRTFLVGTGSKAAPTPVGVYVTTRRQVGWYTPEYTVAPVVRFLEGSGYAFHSRLYYPGTDRLMDARIGFPVSHGCVRMYTEDVRWIYDNVPVGTTVVVF